MHNSASEVVSGYLMVKTTTDLVLLYVLPARDPAEYLADLTSFLTVAFFFL